MEAETLLRITVSSSLRSCAAAAATMQARSGLLVCSTFHGKGQGVESGRLPGQKPLAIRKIRIFEER